MNVLGNAPLFDSPIIAHGPGHDFCDTTFVPNGKRETYAVRRGNAEGNVVTDDSSNDKKSAMEIVKYLFKDIREKDLTSVAKQIVYDVLFAIAPLLIFITAIAGIITRQVNADQQNPVVPVIDWMEENLPSDAAEVLSGPVESALTTSPGFLVSFGAILALWGGKNAVAAVMKGLNFCYHKEDSRSWIKRQLIAIGLTASVGLALGVTSLALVMGSQFGTRLFEAVGLEDTLPGLISILRWPVAIVLLVLAVTMLHYFGPDVEAPVRWFLPGAIVSVVLWGVAIFGLQIYFSIAGDFEAYGIFGAMLVFIYWLWVMGVVMLIGGSFNYVFHHPIPNEDEGEAPEPAGASTG